MTVSVENSISKPDVYETKNIQLTSRMLHIGSAVSQLNPFEYVDTGESIYQPNQEALARAFKAKGGSFLNDYIYRIEHHQEIISLLRNAFGEDWKTLKTDDGELIFPKKLQSRKWTGKKITSLRPMIRNGFGELYIPGSSIKGAIRTAIAYHLLRDPDRYHVPSEVRVSEIEKKLRQSFTTGELKRKAKFYDDEAFMNQLFCNFSLKDSWNNNSTGPNTDFMRAVHVSDSQPLLERKVEKRGKKIILNRRVVAEVMVSSHFPDYKAKYRSPIYTELVHNLRTQFSIMLDRELLSRFSHKQNMQIPFRSVEDLIEICENFAQEQWDFEHDYWVEIKNNNADGRDLDFSEIKDFYKPEECPYTLRVGWASGMAGTTVNTLLDDDLRAEIRDVCGNKAPGFEAPKSRRTVIDAKGEIKYVPGWVKFKVL
ncbi:type III-A CRISPR-associated RAMP protein Csm5 [Roseofilum sp. BLCC_M91]|uniref:CRISPR system Cms protein Csm5 n=1 Tax=Roseofilum halophilum BLCC-M91 TaxID=3022259 RepID=A0ABT7BND3_9CYAN|nr:type III-A CRISPR-associated RAMP protein Csm5 [Roseofilum halophilum]MDJ1180704.1 type III-A CRISPR-associated RAMP protein Csm5 [Roseofilum halophilum BLCC-M91]